MDNLFDLLAEISQLQKKAAELKTRDFDKVVVEIRTSMSVYGITAKDLEKSKRIAKAGKANVTGVGKKITEAKPSKMAGKPVAVKFRGPAGETWTGRGLSPKWLKALVDQGAARESFAGTE